MRYFIIGSAIVVTIALVLCGFIFFLPQAATDLAVDFKRAQAGLERKEIVLPDGLRFVYLEGGKGSPLLLLHGFGGNKDNFALIARHLTEFFHVVIPDHIGFGESDRPHNADYSPPVQARRLKEFAHATGLAQVHIGGSSMGGHIALTYAALFPSEVKSLWLLDPGGLWSAPESEMQRVIRQTGTNPLMAETEADFIHLYHFVMGRPPFIPRPMLRAMARERIENYDLEARIFQQATADDVETRIKGLATPTLIVWGDQDRAISVATADRLHQLMPDSRVVIMKGIGHLPMLESPHQCAMDYLKFRTGLADKQRP